jgi:hypothetical protein
MPRFEDFNIKAIRKEENKLKSFKLVSAIINIKPCTDEKDNASYFLFSDNETKKQSHKQITRNNLYLSDQ